MKIKKETLKHYLTEGVEYKVHDCMWEGSVKTSYLSLSYRVGPVFGNIPGTSQKSRLSKDK